MKLLALLELASVLMFVLFMLTQVIWPLITKTPMLWLFRKTPQKDIDKLQAKMATEDVRAEADQLRSQYDEQVRRNADQLRSRIAQNQPPDDDDLPPSRPSRRRVVVPGASRQSRTR